MSPAFASYQLPREHLLLRIYFEVIEYVLQKAILVGILIFFDPGSIGQLLLGLLVCFIYSCLVCYLMPYAERSDNVLAIATQFSLFLTMLMSVAVSDESFDNDAPPSGVVNILIVSAVALDVAPTLVAVAITANMALKTAKQKVAKKPKATIAEKTTGDVQVDVEVDGVPQVEHGAKKPVGSDGADVTA